MHVLEMCVMKQYLLCHMSMPPTVDMFSIVKMFTITTINVVDIPVC